MLGGLIRLAGLGAGRWMVRGESVVAVVVLVRPGIRMRMRVELETRGGIFPTTSPGRRRAGGDGDGADRRRNVIFGQGVALSPSPSAMLGAGAGVGVRIVIVRGDRDRQGRR